MQIFDEIFSMQILDEISSIQIFDEIFSMHIFDEIFLKFSMLILDEFSFDFFFEQIQKWQVLAVSCIHAFSSPSSYFLLHLTIFLYCCISRYGKAIRWVVNSACHRFEPVTESM